MSIPHSLKVLSFDLGHSFGWAYKDSVAENFGHGKYLELTDWGDQVKELLDLWKPTIVVVSQTNNFGHFNATRSMLKQSGVVFYICGKKNIPGVEFNDSTARKAALGKGMKKVEVQKLFPGVQGDALDALILARGWVTLQSDS